MAARLVTAAGKVMVAEGGAGTGRRLGRPSVCADCQQAGDTERRQRRPSGHGTHAFSSTSSKSTAAVAAPGEPVSVTGRTSALEVISGSFE